MKEDKMKTFTATEAGRNFSSVIKAVDEDGAIEILKHGGKRYVLLSQEMYSDAVRMRFFGKRGQELCKIETIGSWTYMYQILTDGDALTYQVTVLPWDLPSIVIHGKTLTVTADFTGRKEKIQKAFYTGSVNEEDPQTFYEEITTAISEIKTADVIYDMDLQIMVPNYRGELVNHTSPL